MTHWGERRQYSLAHDEEVSRISGWDEHCQEHWIVIPCGKDYRARRDAAVFAIQDHINDDKPAGAVV